MREVFSQWGREGVTDDVGQPVVDPNTGKQRSRLTNQISIMPVVPYESGIVMESVAGPFVPLGMTEESPRFSEETGLHERVKAALNECLELERRLSAVPQRIITTERF